MAKVRPCISLEASQRDWLREQAQARGTNVSELIRELIDREMARVERPADRSEKVPWHAKLWRR